MLSPYERADLLAKARAATPGNRHADPATSGPDCGVVYADNGEPVLQVFANTYNEEKQEEYGEHDIAFYTAISPGKVVSMLESNQFLCDEIVRRDKALKEALTKLFEESNAQSQSNEHIQERHAWGKVRMEVYKLASSLNIPLG